MLDLALAVQAARVAEWPIDEEFGCHVTDLSGARLELDVTWACYRSEGAGVLWRVKTATPVGPAASGGHGA